MADRPCPACGHMIDVPGTFWWLSQHRGCEWEGKTIPADEAERLLAEQKRQVAAGALTLDVTLKVGDFSAVVGSVEAPTRKPAPRGGNCDPLYEVDMPAFRANLAALLREAADCVEGGSA